VHSEPQPPELQTPVKTILRQFKGRDHGHLVQFIKYALAGGVATVVHISIFYFLSLIVLPAMQAGDPVGGILNISLPELAEGVRARNATINNLVAFMISNFVVYQINIHWVFESGRHNRWVELGMFYLVAGASVFIGTALMAFLIATRGLSTTVAFGVNVVVALAMNYAARKFFIFKG
jgi:putative flippase GtrA